MCGGGVLLLRGLERTLLCIGRSDGVGTAEVQGRRYLKGEEDCDFRLFVDRGSGVPASSDEREGGKLGWAQTRPVSSLSIPFTIEPVDLTSSRPRYVFRWSPSASGRGGKSLFPFATRIGGCFYGGESVVCGGPRLKIPV